MNVFFLAFLACLCSTLFSSLVIFFYFRNKEQNPEISEKLLQQLSRQMFQSFDAMKSSLFQLEKNTQSSLVDSFEKSTRHSTQFLIEQQNRQQQLFGDLSGKLHHLSKWQQDIRELNQKIIQLAKVLDNTNLKGKFGEIQLEVLLKNILPASWIKSQHTLPNKTRVDFMIGTNKETLSLCIDSKFPVQSYRLLVDNPENQQYLRDFIGVIKKNIQDISEKYIIPTLTLDFAVLFVPSESIFSQILLFEDLVDFAQKKKVLLCSPQTLQCQLLMMKKVIIEIGIERFTESKAHLIEEIAQENEQLLDKIHAIEKKTLNIQRDLKTIEQSAKKQMRFMGGLIDRTLTEDEEIKEEVL